MLNGKTCSSLTEARTSILSKGEARRSLSGGFAKQATGLCLVLRAKAKAGAGTSCAECILVA